MVTARYGQLTMPGCLPDVLHSPAAAHESVAAAWSNARRDSLGDWS